MRPTASQPRRGHLQKTPAISKTRKVRKDTDSARGFCSETKRKRTIKIIVGVLFVTFILIMIFGAVALIIEMDGPF